MRQGVDTVVSVVYHALWLDNRLEPGYLVDKVVVEQQMAVGS